MQLRNARLCLDCEEVHDAPQCPTCASETFAFITRWVPARDRRVRPRPAEPPKTEDVQAYQQMLTDDDQLTFLADVIAVPQPIGQAVSVGDIFVYAGLTWLIVAAMRGWTPSERPAGSRRRRGRHRQGAAKEDPEIRSDLGFHPPGATRSGTGP